MSISQTNIRPFIIRLFNIKNEDGPKFQLLFFHSFFQGIFISVFFVPANSVFIQHFGSSYLPIAYLVSGGAGYLMSLLYSFLQKRLNSKTLFISALSFVVVLTLLSRLGLFFVDEKWLSFFIFIWAWPTSSLLAIESGGLAIKQLNLRQVKRMFGAIGIGGILASILGYLLIPVVLPYLSHAYDLLIIAATGVIISIFYVVIIFRRFPEEVVKTNEKTKQSEIKTSFKDLFKEKYFRLIIISSSISMIVIYFTDFAYLSGLKGQSNLIEGPEELSNFIALVCATFKIGELLSSYFSSRLLARYGVRLGLTALPYFATFLMLFATFTGFLAGTANIVFFTLIVLNKMAERILRRGLDDPAFNLLYQPLPPTEQLKVQTRIGIIQQASIGIAGALLLLVSFVISTDDGIRLEIFTLIFLPLLFLWAFIATKLYQAYRLKIRQLLSSKSKNIKRDIYQHSYGTELLAKKIKDKRPDIARISVTILSETNPDILETYLNTLLRSKDKTIVKAVLRNALPTWSRRTIAKIKKVQEDNPTGDLYNLATEAIEIVASKNLKDELPDDFEALSKSNNFASKLLVIKYMSKFDVANSDEILLKYLDDKCSTIKKSAIRLARRSSSRDVIRKMVSLLRNEELYHIAVNALLDIGENALDELEAIANINSRPKIVVRVIEIYAKIGTTNAQKLILNYLNYQSRRVQHAAIQGLFFCRFQSNDENISSIIKKLGEVIDTILWLQAGIADTVSHKNTLKLVQSLDFELNNQMELMFKLLTLIYDWRIISLIKKNIIGENVIFALEIVDNFFSQEIKQLIIPILDSLSISQRIKKLQALFPQERLKPEQRLLNIVTKSHLRIDNWTRTKAIEMIGRLHKKKQSHALDSEEYNLDSDISPWTEENVQHFLSRIKKSEIPDEIFLCIHHTDKLVYEMATKTVYDENPVRCFDYLRKLSDKKKALINLFDKDNGVKNYMLADKIKLIKKVSLFFGMPENILIQLARVLSVVRKSKKEFLELTPPNNCNNVFLVLKGELRSTDKKTPQFFSKNDIIVPGLNLNSHTTELQITRDSLLLVGERALYFNLLIDETELIKHIFEDFEENY